jgi:hypothetical protein
MSPRQGSSRRFERQLGRRGRSQFPIANNGEGPSDSLFLGRAQVAHCVETLVGLNQAQLAGPEPLSFLTRPRRATPTYMETNDVCHAMRSEPWALRSEDVEYYPNLPRAAIRA